MAELATAAGEPAQADRRRVGGHRDDGRPRLEHIIDELDERFDPPTEFVVPGADAAWPRCSTWPAPSCAGPSGRRCVAAAPPSLVVPYLNRLSDLLWTMARWQEGRIVSPTRQATTPNRTH